MWHAAQGERCPSKWHDTDADTNLWLAMPFNMKVLSGGCQEQLLDHMRPDLISDASQFICMNTDTVLTWRGSNRLTESTWPSTTDEDCWIHTHHSDARRKCASKYM